MNVIHVIRMRKRRLLSLDKTPVRSKPNEFICAHTSHADDISKDRLSGKNFTTPNKELLSSQACEGYDVVWDNNSPSPRRNIQYRKKCNDLPDNTSDINNILGKLNDQVDRIPACTPPLLGLWMERKQLKSNAAVKAIEDYMMPPLYSEKGGTRTKSGLGENQFQLLLSKMDIKYINTSAVKSGENEDRSQQRMNELAKEKDKSMTNSNYILRPVDGKDLNNANTSLDELWGKEDEDILLQISDLNYLDATKCFKPSTSFLSSSTPVPDKRRKRPIRQCFQLNEQLSASCSITKAETCTNLDLELDDLGGFDVLDDVEAWNIVVKKDKNIQDMKENKNNKNKQAILNENISRSSNWQKSQNSKVSQLKQSECPNSLKQNHIKSSFNKKSCAANANFSQIVFEVNHANITHLKNQRISKTKKASNINKKCPKSSLSTQSEKNDAINVSGFDDAWNDSSAIEMFLSELPDVESDINILPSKNMEKSIQPFVVLHSTIMNPSVTSLPETSQNIYSGGPDAVDALMEEDMEDMLESEVLSMIDQVESLSQPRCTPDEIARKREEALQRKQNKLKLRNHHLPPQPSSKTSRSMKHRSSTTVGRSCLPHK